MADDPNANLLFAIRMRDLQGVRNALEMGANPNFIFNGNTPLLSISESVGTKYINMGFRAGSIIMDSLEIATELLDAGADINYQNPDDGNTALIYAVQGARNDLITMLISRGADERIKNNQGMTALDVCQYPVCRQIILNKQKRAFKQQATNSIPMLAAQYARSTPQTRREWFKILLLQKHAEICEDEDQYRYLGALWGLAEILDVGYGDLMFDKSGLCDRIREKLRQDA